MTGVKSIFEFHLRWENINGTVKLTRVLGTGYWILGTGDWVSWVLGTGYWVLGTEYWRYPIFLCQIMYKIPIEDSL